MFREIRSYLVSLSRSRKVFIQLVSDILILNSTYVLLFFGFLFNDSEILSFQNFPAFGIILSVDILSFILINIFCLAFIYVTGGYRSFFRTSGAFDLIGLDRIFIIFLFSLMLTTEVYLNGSTLIDCIRVGILIFLISFFSLIILRSVAFTFLSIKSENSSQPILIYGAGQAGRETAASLMQNSKYNLIGFIDDNLKIKNFNLLGHKVLGDLKKLNKLKRKFPNLLVIFAIVNISMDKRREIISRLEEFEVHVKTIPSNYGILDSKLTINEISLSDLIDRETSKPDDYLLSKNIKDKVILISGAGGSIGSEISYQVACLKPSKLILVDHTEFNLYKLKEELKTFKNFDSMSFVLMDIRKTNYLDRIIHKNNVDTIFHASAYKHVPLLEESENFQAAIENNFFATFNLCEIAYKNKVSNFVLISSDKAVNPPNLMGATKRLAELSLQAFSDLKESSTIFSMVRFGNVLNSSGSVVPLFWEQISSGGPVTVTHKDVNRYFMTIKEASTLVIQSGAMATGGEVFFLDMGNPIKIKELAERMIRLSGNSVSIEGISDGIEIIYSGLRPGEKLSEELLINKNFLETEHPSIKKAIENKFTLDRLSLIKKEIEDLISTEEFKKARNILFEYIKNN